MGDRAGVGQTCGQLHLLLEATQVDLAGSIDPQQLIAEGRRIMPWRAR